MAVAGTFLTVFDQAMHKVVARTTKWSVKNNEWGVLSETMGYSHFNF
jgi:hypothetical protein